MASGIQILKKLFGKPTKSDTRSFWAVAPKIKYSNFFGFNSAKSGIAGEELYKYQRECLSNYMLINDTLPNVEILNFRVESSITNLKWLNKGELVAGSFIANTLCNSLNMGGFEASDIDIFFKSKEDAWEFAALNGMNWFPTNEQERCVYIIDDQLKYNLVWSNNFSCVEDLISRFDIRACSVAYDPGRHEIFCVKDAISDLSLKKIVFNPVPNATSVARLIKYIRKGFDIDAYQRLFFAELISSDIYSKETELTTGSGV